MNFLVVEGYKDAALKFEKESGIKGKRLVTAAELDEEFIDMRIEIRRLIEEGRINEATEQLNNLNQEVSNSDCRFWTGMKICTLG